MKIDRSNYEKWFIDWLDGNLDEHHAEQINLFLIENPDLQEELKEFESTPIIPPPYKFSGKSGLYRTPADISDIQFEYLCAAYIENDLSNDEFSDLSEIINTDHSRSNILEFYKKLKLAPSDIRFQKKKPLLKNTPLQKVIRISAFRLSAAATIAILIISYVAIYDKDWKRADNLSRIVLNEGRIIHSYIPQPVEYAYPELSVTVTVKNGKPEETTVNKLTAFAVDSGSVEKFGNESIPEALNTEMIHSVEVPRRPDIIRLDKANNQNSCLISLSFDDPKKPDERWAVGRFLARVFRDKILKEKTTDDSPIKGYEIAEAGVTGLNKLLGWQMAFEKNTDENGELKSIYFSSRILKVQAPVNKTETR